MKHVKYAKILLEKLKKDNPSPNFYTNQQRSPVNLCQILISKSQNLIVLAGKRYLLIAFGIWANKATCQFAKGEFFLYINRKKREPNKTCFGMQLFYEKKHLEEEIIRQDFFGVMVDL